MNLKASIPLPLLALVALAAGCDDSECRPDGSCFRAAHTCIAGTCRQQCTIDVECGPEAYCNDAIQVCLEGARPVIDAGAPIADTGVPDTGVEDVGASDSGIPACRGETGSVGCGCFGNQTCEFGLECSSDVCLDATGKANQPCFRNGTCEMGLSCIRTGSRLEVCRLTGTGTVTGACFDTTLEPSAQPCLSAGAACEGGLCLGVQGNACMSSEECARGFDCERGQCERVSLCESALHCESGELCCGEQGTPFAAASACPSSVEVGECFAAPSATYAQSCSDHAQCAPAPAMSPRETGTSLCMRWDDEVCSAPCDPSARSSGCPNRWRCETSYLTCMVDDDCGAPGLTCVGANEPFGRQGRCQCGTVSTPVTCTSSAASGLPTSTCTPDPRGTDAFCVVDAHCVPPSR